MDYSEHQLQSLLEASAQKERQARQRALLLTLVPLAVAVLLVWFTGTQIEKLNIVRTDLNKSEQVLTEVNAQLADSQNNLSQVQRDYDLAQQQLLQKNLELLQVQKNLESTTQALDQAQREMDVLQNQLKDLIRQIEELTAQLHDATTFLQHQVGIDEEELKDWASDNPPALFDVLLEVIEMQMANVKWNITGRTPDQGFDSPRFAAYILEQRALLPRGYDIASTPWAQLPKIPRPDSGDLVVYESGYTMFYYNLGGKEFVIGMTPLGILALRPDFASQIGYLNIEYQGR